MFYKNYTSISIYLTLVDVAKQAGWVRFRSSQLGHRSKRVTGQNGSFLNMLNELRVKRVRTNGSNPFFHIYPLRKRDRKICKENTIAIRTKIASQFKRNINKDHSPRILPRNGFFAQSLFFFTFLLSLIRCVCCWIH